MDLDNTPNEEDVNVVCNTRLENTEDAISSPESNSDRVEEEEQYWDHMDSLNDQEQMCLFSISCQKTYKVLTAAQIGKCMDECIECITSIIQMPSSTVRLLLRCFDWDTDKLMERFCDVEKDVLLKEAHVISAQNVESESVTYALCPHHVNPAKVSDVSTTSLIEFECSICYSSYSSSDVTGLGCGHYFCNLCWVNYLTTKIMDEGMGQMISCPADHCLIRVGIDTLCKLVKDDKVLSKYHHLIRNSFVTTNEYLRWCPSHGCDLAVQVEEVSTKSVTCTCGHTFCFGCGEVPHDPVSCKYLHKWLKCLAATDDSEGDSATLHWISAYTKNCPKCRVPIEKNGGCNRMTCTQTGCAADFCWNCLHLWEDYEGGRHHSNRCENAVSNLRRYVIYNIRYARHVSSHKKELKIRVESITASFRRLYSPKPEQACNDVEFLAEAVEVLLKCHQMLKFTYVFAYYLGRNAQATLLEDNLANMELEVEELSKYLESTTTNHTVMQMTEKVQDKCRHCELWRKALLDHIHEGHETDLWVYREDE